MTCHRLFIHLSLAFLLMVPVSHAGTAGKADTVSIPEAVALYDKRFPNIPLQELKLHLQNHSAVVIDANRESTFFKGHIPGALPLYRLKEDPPLAKRMLPKSKNKLIIVYCGGPQCTSWHKAADFATAHGYRNIRHYKDGLKGWKAAGEQLASDR